MSITNTSARHVVFRIKTTSPKHYTTKPHQGMILPGESMSVLVTVVGYKQEPDLATLKVKDKFLIQSADVPHGQEEGTVQDIMAKAAELEKTGFQSIRQRKLRVCFLPPQTRSYEPDTDEVGHQTDSSDLPGIEESAVLVDRVHSMPHENSGSSMSSPEALGDTRGTRALDASMMSNTSHEASGIWHEGVSELMQSVREDVKPSLGSSAISTATLDPTSDSTLKQRKMSEYYIDDTASGQESHASAPPSSQTDPTVSTSRLRPILQQTVPLWTILASAAVTYTATHFLGL